MYKNKGQGNNRLTRLLALAKHNPYSNKMKAGAPYILLNLQEGLPHECRPGAKL